MPLDAHNSASNQAFIDDAKKTLLKGQLNSVLNGIHNYVINIFLDVKSTAQFFGCKELDELCLSIGRKNLDNLNYSYPYLSNQVSDQKKVIYIVSRLQGSGGHSRLVLDFIRAQPSKEHLILSTGVGGKTDDAFLSQLFAIDPNARFLSAPRGCLRSRLTWLQNMLLSYSPGHVHLLNHHQDSVAVAAMVPELGVKGSFHHHGDHHFCLGIFLEHLTHVDFHPMGYHLCREELGIKNTYLPLTSQDKQNLLLPDGFKRNSQLTTATVARSNKIEVPYHCSYLDVIPKMLKATNGRHIHIGGLSPWGLWRMRKGMRKLGVPNDRLVYIKHSSSIWKSLQEHNVDIYIASFPYGAGLTLIEAMGAGIPVIMHQHIHSRVLSGLELAYPEAFCWRNPEELILHLANLNLSSLSFERLAARKRYEQFHKPEVLSNFFHDPAAFCLEAPELSKKYISQDSNFINQIRGSDFSISHFFYSIFYRNWKKFRRFLS